MLKVALLGPEGTYTHQAAKQYFGEFKPVWCSSIAEIFEADADRAIIPFENTLGGGVTESIDLLREKDAEITGEQRIRISHRLLSNEENKEDIKTVKSHPQALSQCRDYLSEFNWKEKEASSTAQAVESLEEGEAAIASEIAGELNGLNVLDSDIQDSDSNVTRFFILNGENGSGDKTALILEPGEDRPGLLSNMLSCFSGHSINLSYIQSRPTKDSLGEYFFFVEAEANKDSLEMKESLRCLESYAEVDLLGSYKGDQV